MRSARALVAAAAALALAACGDNNPGQDTDAGTDGPVAIDAAVDAAPDAPPDAATFTTFVIDQVMNQTTATGAPVPFTAFSTLPDPDRDNPGAYDPLFP